MSVWRTKPLFLLFPPSLRFQYVSYDLLACGFIQREKAPESAKKRQPAKPRASPKAKAAPRANRKKVGEGTAEEEENLLPNDARKYFKQGQKFITPPNVRHYSGLSPSEAPPVCYDGHQHFCISLPSPDAYNLATSIHDLNECRKPEWMR